MKHLSHILYTISTAIGLIIFNYNLFFLLGAYGFIRPHSLELGLAGLAAYWLSSLGYCYMVLSTPKEAVDAVFATSVFIICVVKVTLILWWLATLNTMAFSLRDIVITTLFIVFTNSLFVIKLLWHLSDELLRKKYHQDFLTN